MSKPESDILSPEGLSRRVRRILKRELTKDAWRLRSVPSPKLMEMQRKEFQSIKNRRDNLLPITEAWETAVGGITLSRAVYRDMRPDLVYQTIEGLQGLRGIVDNFSVLDCFQAKRINIALSEFESFRNPLAKKQIQSVDKVFKPDFLFFHDKDKARLATLVTAMATRASLDTWHEGKYHMPVGLRTLRNALFGYFDSYMASFYLEGSDAIHASKSLLSALACYIPARLGITPSSAMKLYLAREKEWSTGLAGQMQKETAEAYVVKSLPDEVQGVYQPSPKADEAAGLVIRRYYAGKGNEDREVALTESSNNLSQLLTCHESLTEDLMKSSHRLVRIDLAEGLPFSRLVMTSQNELTLMFVLQGENASLLLEIDKKGRIFGISPKLAVQQPHLKALLAADILPGVMDYVKERYPEIFRPGVKIVKPKIDEPQITEVKLAVVRCSNKRRNSEPVQISQVEVSAPEAPVEAESKFTIVNLDEEEIRKRVKRISNTSCKHLMNALRGFEKGIGDSEIITSAGSDNWVVRAKKAQYRVKLIRMGGNMFMIDEIFKKSILDCTRRRQRKLTGKS